MAKMNTIGGGQLMDRLIQCTEKFMMLNRILSHNKSGKPINRSRAHTTITVPQES